MGKQGSSFKYSMKTPDVSMSMTGIIRSPEHSGVVMCALDGQLADDANLLRAAPKLKAALAAMLDFWGGYECPQVDAAIAVMQELGEDRWSMQAQMDASKIDGQT
jgi:hypothetical protein